MTEFNPPNEDFQEGLKASADENQGDVPFAPPAEVDSSDETESATSEEVLEAEAHDSPATEDTMVDAATGEATGTEEAVEETVEEVVEEVVKVAEAPEETTTEEAATEEGVAEEAVEAGAAEDAAEETEEVLEAEAEAEEVVEELVDDTPPPEKQGFEVGDIVQYGLHGRCQIIGMEDITLDGNTTAFFNLQTTKTVGARHQGVDARVLVPVDTAEKKGLRHPLNHHTKATPILAELAKGDAYFEVGDHWKKKQKQLDDVIRNEGATGLAKALGHLVYVQETTTSPMSSEGTKYFRLIKRVLAREISEARGDKSTRDAERMINKAIQDRADEIKLAKESG